MDFLERTFGENPLQLVLVLAVISAFFIVGFFITQNGRQLIRAGVILALAGMLLLIDYFWTTDREKLAQIVSQIATAVRNNDLQAVQTQLTADAIYTQPGISTGVTFDSPLGKTLLREALDQVKFDFLNVRGLTVSAGKKTGRGKADFNVYCAGTWNPPLGGSAINFPPTSSSWSFGFRRMKDQSWKVDRITPTQLPATRGRSSLPPFLRQ
ncbi:MAG: hypothetical protein RJA81_862 [Planctomycetota bacterium]